MLRGPNLYPTVATRWVDDVGFLKPTRHQYLSALRRFHKRVQAARPGTRFAGITPEDVRDFVEVGENGDKRADRSRKQFMGIIGSLYDWAMSTEVALVTTNPTARLRAQYRHQKTAPTDVRRRTWLEVEQTKTLLATTRAGGRAIDRRDYVLLALYFHTGLRLVELPRIRWTQVNFASGEYGMLVDVLRKNRQVVDVALNQYAQRILFEWRSEFVAAVGPDIGDLSIIPRTLAVPEVVGVKGAPRTHEILWRRPLRSPSSVRQIVADRAKAVGIHLRPHDLRRSHAAMLEDLGADLREIQASLGHKNFATTEIYLKKRTRLSKAAQGLDLG